LPRFVQVCELDYFGDLAMDALPESDEFAVDNGLIIDETKREDRRRDTDFVAVIEWYFVKRGDFFIIEIGAVGAAEIHEDEVFKGLAPFDLCVQSADARFRDDYGIIVRAAYGHLAPVGDSDGRFGVADDKEVSHGYSGLKCVFLIYSLININSVNDYINRSVFLL
jgi:hypothetical protein